ncbi:ProQ/FINO family protein [Billgrantia lactosivorans]|uniref:ProQ/FINO family protein n=1 Tax=Billgrantia lactosivorans TaxID=2185141 RepID=UPI001FE362DD|nr:ProQ/FINO family protein [Halomonas lactosivorans]
MTEQRSRHLLSALESRAASALEELHRCRAQLERLEAQLGEAEAARQELEAARLELMEENRELDEQNRELEEDNARLRERLRKGEPAPVFPGATRRAQGLAALMGQRPRDDAHHAGTARETAGGAAVEAAPASESSPGEAAPEASAAQREAPAADEPSGQPEPGRHEGHERQDSTQQGASTADARQGRLAIEQAPSADALLREWYQRYPSTFFKGHTRPLKVGIHHDLAAREPWPEKLVRRALAGYVNLPRYLKAVREGAERIDLDGAPAGSVDAQAAEHARRKLERLQSERRERGRTAGGPPRRNDKAVRGREGAKGQPRKARAVPTAQAAPTDPPAAPADPEARMEAKLSALLAKHNGQAKGQ